MANNRAINRNPAGRRTTPEPETLPPQPAEVKVDFGVSDERYNYIRSKLDDIMQNIGRSYSDRLTQELIRRLEKTITDFHTEVVTILERLEKLQAEREKPAEPEPEVAAPAVSEPDDSGMSEWEKRLEERERLKSTESSQPGSEAGQKTESRKGLFGRKK
jgi:hypothetical protein